VSVEKLVSQIDKLIAHQWRVSKHLLDTFLMGSEGLRLRQPVRLLTRYEQAGVKYYLYFHQTERLASASFLVLMVAPSVTPFSINPVTRHWKEFSKVHERYQKGVAVSSNALLTTSSRSGVTTRAWEVY
jgi:hypothetical protein